MKVLFGGVVAVVGALTAESLEVPLPWLLGPLFFVGVTRLFGAPIATIKPLRNVGQWIIGVSLGLYFTPDIVELILRYWLVLALGMALALVLGILGTWMICQIARVDVKTAWFSAAIGGASEMSSLAERYGARVDLVASAHSLRVLAVVTIIPFGFEFASIVGSDLSILAQPPLDYQDISVIAFVAFVFGLGFSHFGVASAWVLGPLAAAALLTVLELTTTSIPIWVVNTGQLFLGWTLGDRYRATFFKAAPRFMVAVGLFSITSIVIVAMIGFVASKISGLSLPTVWLGMAPGGLAEMAITAKVLALGVPMVTAFQVSRMTFVVIATAFIYEKYIAPKNNKALAQ